MPPHRKYLLTMGPQMITDEFEWNEEQGEMVCYNTNDAMHKGETMREVLKMLFPDTWQEINNITASIYFKRLAFYGCKIEKTTYDTIVITY